MSIYSSTTLPPMRQALIDELIANGTSGHTIEIRDADDTVMCVIGMQDPPFVFDGTKLAFTASNQGIVAFGGTAATAVYKDGTGVEMFTLPCVLSTVTRENTLSLSAIQLLAGATISISDFSIGA
jgi:hypothetical protein